MKKIQTFKLYGIFGHPLRHTLSPVMHEAAYRKLGISAFYLAFDLDRPHFRGAMRRISRLPLSGFNVTVPHKEEVMRYVRLTPEAKAIGAVNTVFRKGARWFGANTDVQGFLDSLSRDGKFHARGKSALVLGAGGGARAVVYGLAKTGARTVVIVNRRIQRAQRIIRDYKRFFPNTELRAITLRNGAVRKHVQASHLVVNTTSVGLKPKDGSVLPASFIPKTTAANRKLFFDLIYHPAPTAFLRAARSKGHRILSGEGMLIHQGAHAFRLWIRKKPDLSVMRQALNQALKTSRV